MARTVGRVAAEVGTTVRALHHYDEIGLVRPSGRTGSGYRVYDDADVDRLRQVLTYRSLGLSLEDVRHVLDDPAADARAHLRRSRALLLGRVDALHDAVARIDRALQEEETMTVRLSAQERREIFGDWLPEEYEAEARERWGDTEAWAESRRRTSSYGPDEWRAAKADGDAAEAALVQAMHAGEPAGSVRARAAAEQHRQVICRWYYDCPPAMHRSLGEMWVQDERFRTHHEEIAPGLAGYARDAAAANADTLEAADGA